MIIVLADDLSGAAELAGVAVRHGLSAELQTRFTPGTDAEVICLATDTRSLPAEQAARVVTAITNDIVAANPTWLFKKCDSVLRGPVLPETRAMAVAADKTRALILSANPSRGRVIRNGTYLINGQPLHETIFAHDPEHPRTTSQVAELLGGDLSAIETPDAQTSADVRICAAAIDDQTLPVGGADFFEALLQIRVPARSALHPPAATTAGASLLVCGSTVTWAKRRATALARGIPVFALPHDVAAAIQAAKTSRQTLLGIGDGPATTGQSPAVLVGKLAETVAAILGETTVTRLLIESGATAAAVMRALGWTRLRASNVPIQGVGVMQPIDATGPTLFIKPGSYPWPEEMWPGIEAKR